MLAGLMLAVLMGTKAPLPGNPASPTLQALRHRTTEEPSKALPLFGAPAGGAASSARRGQPEPMMAPPSLAFTVLGGDGLRSSLWRKPADPISCGHTERGPPS
jgi:hypothetical protein